MALRFTKEKVALDIVGSRAKDPVVIERNGWRILRVSYEQLEDYQTCRKVMNLMAELLGSSAPQEPGWEDRAQQLHSLVLARSA